MKIALLGTRGIPAQYGGFETFAEELSARLARRGHQVTVYGRVYQLTRSQLLHRGVTVRLLPAPPSKYFDTVVHTFLSTLDLLLHRHDVVLYCNAANAVFTLLPRLAGMPAALNVDGVERRRQKWNLFGRGWYWFSEHLALWFPTEVVSDAAAIRKYYQQRYGKETRFIAYGAETGKVETQGTLAVFGLKPDEYFLYVSRMEPENNALLVVKAFERTEVGKKLVMVGDAPYAKDYIRRVKQTSDPRILFTGAVYGTGYHELQSHCFAYIHATEVGGTHPALIEALGRGCCVLYLDTPENREAAGPSGIAYRKDEAELAAAIEGMANLSSERRSQMQEASYGIAMQRYNWEVITDQYLELFEELLQR